MIRPRFRGVSHEIAAVAFPLLALPLVIAAPGGGAKLAVVVYASGVTAMYGVSACYHRGRWSREAKRRMRRLDHSTILCGIAATYTTIAAIGPLRASCSPLCGRWRLRGHCSATCGSERHPG
ncbi:MAG: hypothetical protein NVS3B21_34120 [Acidimicrobiales bacterium]